MQYRLWLVVSAILSRLPLQASYGIAVAAGTAGYYFWPRGRRSTHRNFSRVLRGAPRSEVRRVARRSLVNYCKYLVDFVRFPATEPRGIVAALSAGDAFDQLDAQRAEGRGAVFVCMHFGNWDLGAGAAAARGYPITVVAETFTDPRLDTMVVGARERLGMRVVKMENMAPSLLRALKEDAILALLIDRPTPGEGVRVRFFADDVHVPAGPARLALRSGAKVIPVAFARTQPMRPEHQVLADFSIDLPDTGDDVENVRLLTQSIMDSHARFIRAHPDQWFMFREFWTWPGSRSAA